HIAPRPLITQLIGALAPSGARLTGIMKIAPPMIVPTTSADVIQNPILLSSVSVIAMPPPRKSERLRTRTGRRLPRRASPRLPDHEHDAARHEQAEREQEGLPARAVEGEQDEGEADGAGDGRQRLAVLDRRRDRGGGLEVENRVDPE